MIQYQYILNVKHLAKIEAFSFENDSWKNIGDYNSSQLYLAIRFSEEIKAEILWTIRTYHNSIFWPILEFD